VPENTYERSGFPIFTQFAEAWITNEIRIGAYLPTQRVASNPAPIQAYEIINVNPPGTDSASSRIASESFHSGGQKWFS